MFLFQIQKGAAYGKQDAVSDAEFIKRAIDAHVGLEAIPKKEASQLLSRLNAIRSLDPKKFDGQFGGLASALEQAAKGAQVTARTLGYDVDALKGYASAMGGISQASPFPKQKNYFMAPPEEQLPTAHAMVKDYQRAREYAQTVMDELNAGNAQKAYQALVLFSSFALRSETLGRDTMFQKSLAEFSISVADYFNSSAEIGYVKVPGQDGGKERLVPAGQIAEKVAKRRVDLAAANMRELCGWKQENSEARKQESPFDLQGIALAGPRYDINGIRLQPQVEKMSMGSDSFTTNDVLALALPFYGGTQLIYGAYDAYSKKDYVMGTVMAVTGLACMVLDAFTIKGGGYMAGSMKALTDRLATNMAKAVAKSESKAAAEALEKTAFDMAKMAEKKTALGGIRGTAEAANRELGTVEAAYNKASLELAEKERLLTVKKPAPKDLKGRALKRWKQFNPGEKPTVIQTQELRDLKKTVKGHEEILGQAKEKTAAANLKLKAAQDEYDLLLSYNSNWKEVWQELKGERAWRAKYAQLLRGHEMGGYSKPLGAFERGMSGPGLSGLQATQFAKNRVSWTYHRIKGYGIGSVFGEGPERFLDAAGIGIRNVKDGYLTGITNRLILFQGPALAAGAVEGTIGVGKKVGKFVDGRYTGNNPVFGKVFGGSGASTAPSMLEWQGEFDNVVGAMVSANKGTPKENEKRLQDYMMKAGLTGKTDKEIEAALHKWAQALPSELLVPQAPPVKKSAEPAKQQLQEEQAPAQKKPKW